MSDKLSHITIASALILATALPLVTSEAQAICTTSFRSETDGPCYGHCGETVLIIVNDPEACQVKDGTACDNKVTIVVNSPRACRSSASGDEAAACNSLVVVIDPLSSGSCDARGGSRLYDLLDSPALA